MTAIRVSQGSANPALMNAVKAIAKEMGDDEPFYVANLADVITKYRMWKTNLPRVNPFYAVKTNCDMKILQLMVSLGFGFDCASREEIEIVLRAGAKPSDIIYAHPYKFRTHLQYAKSYNIDVLTFDSESELLKIKRFHPRAKLVIRFRVPDVVADVPLNNKFGCELEDCGCLLRIAKELKLEIIGTSFHVGGLCKEPMAYFRAIKMARDICDMAENLGFEFRLLDLGGGFPGDTHCFERFRKICCCINNSLHEHFPKEKNIDIIAEPGCYFSCSAFTLCTTIIGKKQITIHETIKASEQILYYLNDGVYGSFPYMFEHYGVRMNPLLNSSEIQRRPVKSSKLWGCTCCSFDCVVENCQLPEMEIGEQIVFENMGAYTISLASTFNGFLKPKVRYVFIKTKTDELLSWQGETVKHMKNDDLMTVIGGRRYITYEEDDSNCDLCAFG